MSAVGKRFFFSEHACIQPRSRVPNPIAPKLAKAGIRLVLCAVHRPLRRRSLGARAPVTAQRRRAHRPGEVEPEVDRQRERVRLPARELLRRLCELENKVCRLVVPAQWPAAVLPCDQVFLLDWRARPRACSTVSEGTWV